MENIPDFTGLLHDHPKLEEELKLDSSHVIVDKSDWIEVRRILANMHVERVFSYAKL